MAVTGPNTGFKIVNADGGPTTQDLGQRYVSKDYYLDVYPNLASTTGNRTAPGLWTWGNNSDGRLGLNDLSHRSSPVQVGSLTNWKQVSATNGPTFNRRSVAATKTDGTILTWGNNAYGGLGLNDIAHRSSPTQVGALTNWRQVSIGFDHILSIKTDGTLWGWGNNGYGQIGLSDTGARSSPTQVGTLTNWKQVSGGWRSTVAVKTDGTLWIWGRNHGGAPLGLGVAAHRSSPTQVGTLTNWKQVSINHLCAAAITTDGALWTWGGNNNGGLGLNDTTARSSPTQVGSLTNWKFVSCGSYHITAIKTDGTLWAWGRNSSGELGQNDIVHRSSPVQVGSLTNWKQVAGGSTNTPNAAAIKTDGTLWTWGYNGDGGLGLNNTTSYSSPVQVGSLTNWKQVSAGSNNTVAIQDGYY